MKKADWRLIVGLGAAADRPGDGELSRPRCGRQGPVLVSGQEVAVLPLDRDARYALPHNTVVVSGGEVYMESADCRTSSVSGRDGVIEPGADHLSAQPGCGDH